MKSILSIKNNMNMIYAYIQTYTSTLIHDFVCFEIFNCTSMPPFGKD